MSISAHWKQNISLHIDFIAWNEDVTTFSQECITKNEMCKLGGVYCIGHLWEICKKIGNIDPVHVTQLGPLIRFRKYHKFIICSMISLIQ